MNKGHTPLYTTVTGNTIGYDHYTFGSGPKNLYIQGGIHGGEITYFIFQKVYTFLREHEAELTAEVALAPLSNPRAWEQRTYYYTAGKFDWYKGKDWNRSFPGSPDTDLSSRMSHRIFEMASQYSLCIDLHTARTSAPYMIFTQPRMVLILQTLGLPLALYASAGQYAGSFLDACAQTGVDALAIECGSHDAHEAAHIEEVSAALIALIRSRCMASSGTPDITVSAQLYASRVTTLYAPLSGFITYHAHPRAHVAAGDVIATVLSGSDLSEHIEIVAPAAGIILECARTHICTVGDELIRYIADTDCAPLDSLVHLE